MIDTFRSLWETWVGNESELPLRVKRWPMPTNDGGHRDCVACSLSVLMRISLLSSTSVRTTAFGCHWRQSRFTFTIGFDLGVFRIVDGL